MRSGQWQGGFRVGRPRPPEQSVRPGRAVQEEERWFGSHVGSWWHQDATTMGQEAGFPGLPRGAALGSDGPGLTPGFAGSPQPAPAFLHL